MPLNRKGPYKGYLRASNHKQICYLCAHRTTNLRLATKDWDVPVCAWCLHIHDFDDTLLVETDGAKPKEGFKFDDLGSDQDLDLVPLMD